MIVPGLRVIAALCEAQSKAHLFSLLWGHSLELVIAPNDAQDVEQLSLVLVYSLHLFTGKKSI